MNYNICLAALLYMACINAGADARTTKSQPTVGRVQPRPTQMPPPIPVEEDSATTELPPSVSVQRQGRTSGASPRDQYINLHREPAVPAAPIQKREMTFCDFLSIHQNNLLKPLNRGVRFTISASSADAKMHLLGTQVSREDGSAMAFLYDSTSGDLYTLRNSGAPGSAAIGLGKNEFTEYPVPRDTVITDKDRYKGVEFINAIGHGLAPLCGRYLKLQ